MKHTVEELLNVVHRHYPRRVPYEDLGRVQTEEDRRLVDARRRAGADCERWLGMLRRLREQFPENEVDNFSVHLATGSHDACYSGSLYLPKTTGEHRHAIELRVSFLVPYYIIYSSRLVDDPEEIEREKTLRVAPPRAVSIFVHDTVYILPAWVGKLIRLVKPELVEPPSVEDKPTRQVICFDLSPDEQPYAAGIAREIEARWGYERMPPEVGNVVVPDVATNLRRLGEGRLYDCLFSDAW
ncbi:hypothetical protein WMF37_37695 [Sorangium sp. So ce291]|uniref:hypothetical protein n=1 Tax=Sorangium sp. So ce291 TaxID=3133294 RepID=UPI003F62AE00